MIIFAWIVRVLLLLILLPFLLPLGLIFSTVFLSPLALAMFILAVVLLALGIVLGIALGVIGNLVDLLIVVGLIGIVWHWPRGIKGRFGDKLRLSYRRMRNTVHRLARQCTAADLALCLVVVLIAMVLSLVVILAVIGVVWKWPRNPHLHFFAKLRLALIALRDEIRGLFH